MGRTFFPSESEVEARRRGGSPGRSMPPATCISGTPAPRRRLRRRSRATAATSGSRLWDVAGWVLGAPRDSGLRASSATALDQLNALNPRNFSFRAELVHVLFRGPKGRISASVLARRRWLVGLATVLLVAVLPDAVTPAVAREQTVPAVAGGAGCSSPSVRTQRLGRLGDGLAEASGFASSRKYPGVGWVIRRFRPHPAHLFVPARRGPRRSCGRSRSSGPTTATGKTSPTRSAPTGGAACGSSRACSRTDVPVHLRGHRTEPAFGQDGAAQDRRRVAAVSGGRAALNCRGRLLVRPIWAPASAGEPRYPAVPVRGPSRHHRAEGIRVTGLVGKFAGGAHRGQRRQAGRCSGRAPVLVRWSPPPNSGWLSRLRRRWSRPVRPHDRALDPDDLGRERETSAANCFRSRPASPACSPRRHPLSEKKNVYRVAGPPNPAVTGTVIPRLEGCASEMQPQRTCRSSPT